MISLKTKRTFLNSGIKCHNDMIFEQGVNRVRRYGTAKKVDNGVMTDCTAPGGT